MPAREIYAKCYFIIPISITPETLLRNEAKLEAKKIIFPIRNVKIALWCVIMIRFDSWYIFQIKIGLKIGRKYVQIKFVSSPYLSLIKFMGIFFFSHNEEVCLLISIFFKYTLSVSAHLSISFFMAHDWQKGRKASRLKINIYSYMFLNISKAHHENFLRWNPCINGEGGRKIFPQLKMLLQGKGKP